MYIRFSVSLPDCLLAHTQNTTAHAALIGAELIDCMDAKQMIAEMMTAVKRSRAVVDQSRRNSRDSSTPSGSISRRNAPLLSKVLRARVQGRRLRWPVGELERIATRSANGKEEYLLGILLSVMSSGFWAVQANCPYRGYLVWRIFPRIRKSNTLFFAGPSLRVTVTPVA